MKIGELAQATQISVRTLHHYDEIDLVKPSSRTESGHRIYTEPDIIRLHKIISLRNVGFSLEEIKQFIGYSNDQTQELISRQLEKIESESEELERKKWCIKTAQDLKSFDQYQGVENLVNMIRELSVQSQYLSADERKKIQESNNALGLEKLKEMHERLEKLTKQAQQFLDQNVKPTDPRVVALANEWSALGKEGIGESPEIAKKIQTMMQEIPIFQLTEELLQA